MALTKKQREDAQRDIGGCLITLFVVLLLFVGWQEWTIQSAINKISGCQTAFPPKNFEVSSNGLVIDKSCICPTTLPPTWDIVGIFSGHVTTTCDIQIIVFGYSYNFVLHFNRQNDGTWVATSRH